MQARKILIVTLIFFSSAKNLVAQGVVQLKEVLSATTDHFANNLEFSRDGQWLVNVVGFNADVYGLTSNGFGFSQKLTGGRFQAFYPGISDDGKFISFSNNDETFIYRKDGSNYTKLQTLNHTGKYGIHDIVMRFTGNDKLMIVGGEGNIRFYEWKNEKFVEVARTIHEGGLLFQGAALSPGGKKLVTLDENGVVCCWQIGDRIAVPGLPLLKTNKYTGIIDVSDDGLLVAGETDSLNLYEVSNDHNAVTKLFQFPAGKFGETAFNKDGNRVMFSNKSGELHIYKLMNNAVSLESVNKLDKENFTSIRESPDGRWVGASSSGGKTIKIFEASEKLAAYKRKAPAKVIATKGKPAGVTPKNNGAVAVKSKPVVPVKQPVAEKISKGRAIPYLKKTGKYILVDSVTLKPLSTKEYDEVNDAGEGLTTVSINKKYGFIDRKGNEVVPLKYTYANTFNDGLAFVNLDGNLGFVNKKGEEVIPLQKDILFPNFEEKMVIIVRNKLYGFIDHTGREVVRPAYKSARNFSEGLALVDKTGGGRAFIDKTGKEIVSFPSSYGISDFKGGMATVFADIGKSWLIDKTGKDLLGMKYTQITLSAAGVAILNNKSTYNETQVAGKFGMVSNTGTMILPIEYDYIGLFSETDGIFLVVKGNDYWCINKAGKKLFDYNYGQRQEFAGGRAAVSDNAKWGYINTIGKLVIPLKYENISGTFSDGLANVMLNGKWGFIDGTGKVIIPFRYSSAYGGFENGLAKVKEKEGLNEPWFYVSKKGVEYREK